MSKVPSTFQGPGFSKRHYSLSKELGSLQVNSEYQPLKEAVLFVPGDEIHHLENPDAALHLAPIDCNVLEEQLRAYARTLEQYGVTVHRMAGNHHSPPNLMFVRDLFFNTPEGAVVARMASQVRATEEFYISLELAKNTVPIRLTVNGKGTFEGADALWANPKNLLIGVGQRTNLEAFEQITASLKPLGIKTHKVPVPKGIQHLLGVVQFVDKNLALVRTEKVAPVLISTLKKLKVKILAVKESAEVTEKQGFNIIVVQPRQIVMAAHCPVLKNFYLKNKLKVLAELEISELIKGGGGLGCATGILVRSKA